MAVEITSVVSFVHQKMTSYRTYVFQGCASLLTLCLIFNYSHIVDNTSTILIIILFRHRKGATGRVLCGLPLLFGNPSQRRGEHVDALYSRSEGHLGCHRIGVAGCGQFGRLHDQQRYEVRVPARGCCIMILF